LLKKEGGVRKVKMPDFVTEEHFEYLDEFRELGIANMYGAPVYVEEEFGVSKEESIQIVSYWMKTFKERQKENKNV
jgi:hypothetical protein